jgi:hypothetical protein
MRRASPVGAAAPAGPAPVSVMPNWSPSPRRAVGADRVGIDLHRCPPALRTHAGGNALPVVAVSKWYHLRAVYCLHTQLPQAAPLYAIGWEPVYASTLVTRDNWPSSPDGRRRVIRARHSR